MNRFVSIVFSLMALAGCDVSQAPQAGGVYNITIIPRSSSFTKSILPEEEKISDINLFIFNSNGIIEERQYIKGGHTGGYAIQVRLQKYKVYDFYAIANIGRALQLSKLEDLMNYRHWMAYSDDWANGLVMTGRTEGVCPGDLTDIGIPLERIMAKVMLSVDRYELEEDIDIHFVKAGLSDCPRSMEIFKDNYSQEFIRPGFICEENQTSKLNGKTTSEEIEMYCMENLQTEGTYVELEADYNSDYYYTDKGAYLKYRFYPSKDGLSRNHEYHVCLKLSGDGLNGDGWRIDKSALVKREKTGWCVFHPEPYLECEIGDTVHLWCEYSPDAAKLEIDRDFLEEDTSRGIYDFEIDEDGKGISLFMKSKGTGIVIFDLGDPINEEGMFVVVCEP